MRLRVSLRSLLMLVLIAGLLGAYCVRRDPVGHFRWHRDPPSLWHIFRHKVDLGSTLAEVEALVGPTAPADPTTARVARRKAGRNPAMNPDGVQPDDEFWAIQLPRGQVLIHFRGGRLINYRPIDFDSRSRRWPIAW